MLSPVRCPVVRQDCADFLPSGVKTSKITTTVDMDRASIFEARNYIPPPFNDYNGFFERWSAVTQIPVNELELQDTELWDITAKHPDKLQATLCRLYKANSPVRYMLLWTVAACILESQPQQYWDQLIDSGFPELLWEMSLDTKTYEGLAPNPAPAIREAKVRTHPICSITFFRTNIRSL